MTSENCERCNGFGWVPEGYPNAWYQQDWRLMLDPTVSWEPCPKCSHQQPEEQQVVGALQQQIARMTIKKLEQQADDWRDWGAWRCGLLPEQQVMYRWHDIACLPPGPFTNHQGWMLISDLGVMRSLDHDQCVYHLTRAGAPDLP